MLKLQQIKFQASSPKLLLGKFRKLIRISLDQISRTTTKVSKKPNQNSLTWSQPLFLPLLFGKQFDFEIYNEHKFGYNPEQLNDIYYGKLVITDRNQKQGVWEVSFNNQSIGYLTAHISCTPSVWAQNQLKKEGDVQKSNQLDSQPKAIKIKSLIASVPSIKNETMILQIKIGKDLIKSIYKQKCSTSQFVYLDQIQLFKPQTEYFLKFYIYIEKKYFGVDDTPGKKLLGSGQFYFPAYHRKMYNQHVIMKSRTDGQLKRIGQIFLKYSSQVVPSSKIATMGNKYAQKYKLKISNKNHKPQKKQETKDKQINETRNIKLIEAQIQRTQEKSQIFRKAHQQIIHPSSYRQIPSNNKIIPDRSHSQATFFSEKKSPSSNYSIQIRKKHVKQISVVQKNQDVVFGQQQRFITKYPKTEFKYNINRSFDFSTPIIDEVGEEYQQFRRDSKPSRYYRGASMGRGYKTDFTKLSQNSPGVGSYTLPTIWDRYK